jgi:putative oxidoreductase
MNTRNLPAVALVGRVLLSTLFLISGFGKLAAPAATKAYIASAGLPLPDVAYIVAVIVEVGFGLALLVGYRSRIVATVMALFTLAAAFGFHAHFNDLNQQIHFLKNFAIAGGLLQIAALGAGAWTIDGLLARRSASH